MERLRELRKEKKLSMKELGLMFGLAESTISLYEKGKRQPDNATLIRFADFFGISVDYLLGAEKEKTPPDEVSESEKMLLELFNRVPEDKQELVLQLIRTALEMQ